MTKILIISYFYPPANFVGGERTASWAKHLHQNGFYPIIITRQWNDGQTDLIDKVQKNTLEVEYNGTHEVHRLPYKHSLRDRCARFKWLKPLQKAFTLLELIGSNFFIRALPYSNFYFYSKSLIKSKNDISIVIASGRPFQSFFIGHKLKNDFPNIYWIPDYRDEWTTRITYKPNSILDAFLYKLDKNSELRWTQNASVFLTVSKLWGDQINNLIKKPMFVVMNGFEPITIKELNKPPKKDYVIKIIYVGTLYPYQNIDMLLSAIEELNIEIKVVFIGSNIIPTQNKRLMKLKKQYNFIEILPRFNRKELDNHMINADLFFASSYNELKGCIPVKLFDYYSRNRPILLCPSDNDVMEKFIKETNSGYISNSKESCVTLLKKLAQKLHDNESIMPERNESAAKQYSRKHQTGILAKHLYLLLNEK